MKDRWMNVGFEDEELTPYKEPEADLNDQARIRESIVEMCIIILTCTIYECTFLHSYTQREWYKWGSL